MYASCMLDHENNPLWFFVGDSPEMVLKKAATQCLDEMTCWDIDEISTATKVLKAVNLCQKGEWGKIIDIYISEATGYYLAPIKPLGGPSAKGTQAHLAELLRNVESFLEEELEVI